MERSYEWVLSYGEKEDDDKLGRSNERLTKLERSPPYVIRDEIIITTDKMARAAALDIGRSTTTSFRSGFVEIFELGTIKIWLAVLR